MTLRSYRGMYEENCAGTDTGWIHRKEKELPMTDSFFCIHLRDSLPQFHDIAGFCGFAKVRGNPGLVVHLGKVGGDQERGDLRGKCERRITRILLPSVLLRYRTVPRDKACRLSHHGPEGPRARVLRASFLSARVPRKQGRAPGPVINHSIRRMMPPSLRSACPASDRGHAPA